MTVSTFVRRTLTGTFVAAALSLPAHSASAQKGSAVNHDRDTQTLAAYHLSEAGLRKYYMAMSNLTKLASKNPKLQEEVDNDSSNGDADIASMAAQYDRVPALKSALTSAGITSTEFATFGLSYMQATMTYSLMTQGPEKLRIKEIPKGTPKENVDFIRTHQELIQKLDKELKALQPQP